MDEGNFLQLEFQISCLPTFLFEWYDITCILYLFFQQYNTPFIDVMYAVCIFANVMLFASGYAHCVRSQRAFIRHIAFCDMVTDVPVMVLNIAAGGFPLFGRSPNASFYATFIILVNVVVFFKSVVFNPIFYGSRGKQNGAKIANNESLARVECPNCLNQVAPTRKCSNCRTKLDLNPMRRAAANSSLVTRVATSQLLSSPPDNPTPDDVKLVPTPASPPAPHPSVDSSA